MQAPFCSDSCHKQWLPRMQTPRFDPGFPDSATRHHTGSPFARCRVIGSDSKHRPIPSAWESAFRARQKVCTVNFWTRSPRPDCQTVGNVFIVTYEVKTFTGASAPPPQLPFDLSPS